MKNTLRIAALLSLLILQKIIFGQQPSANNTQNKVQINTRMVERFHAVYGDIEETSIRDILSTKSADEMGLYLQSYRNLTPSEISRGDLAEQLDKKVLEHKQETIAHPSASYITSVE